MGFHYRIYNTTRHYFITLSVVEDIDLFIRDDHRQCIVDSLKFCQEIKGLELNAWCLVSNKLYAIVKASNKGDFSGIIRDLKKFTSKRIVQQIESNPNENSESILRKFKRAAAKNRKGIEFKVWEDGYFPDEIFTTDFL